MHEGTMDVQEKLPKMADSNDKPMIRKPLRVIYQLFHIKIYFMNFPLLYKDENFKNSVLVASYCGLSLNGFSIEG